MDRAWPPRTQIAWGLLGAAAAAWFAIWMLFFPSYVADYFAWDVQPRYAHGVHRRGLHLPDGCSS